MSRFCIVVPTYNSATTLPAAVESALAQDFSDFSVFVSDNASTDGSQSYLNGLDHPRLEKKLWDQCLPKTGNWNRAFLGAPDCEYLVMLHSDDVLAPGTLGHLASAADRAPRATLLFGNHDALSLDGVRKTSRRIWPLGYQVGPRRFDRLQFLCNGVSVVATTFRRDTFAKLGGFSDRYTFLQDMEFFHQVVQHGRAVYVPQRFGLYRDTPPRPANSEKYVREFVQWHAEHRTAFPRALADRLFAAHVDRVTTSFRQEHPTMAEAFERWLADEGFTPLPARPLSTNHLYHAYKLWCSVVPSGR